MTGEVTHRTVETNGIRMHLAEMGNGPLVVLCHGFPKSWYSWRHQLPALAAAGFRAVAPDMRGYGGTVRIFPESREKYVSAFNLCPLDMRNMIYISILAKNFAVRRSGIQRPQTGSAADWQRNLAKGPKVAPDA